MRRCLVAGTSWSGTTNRDSFGGRVPSIDGHKPLSGGAKTLRWANLIKCFQLASGLNRQTAGHAVRRPSFVIFTFQASISTFAANHGCCYLPIMIVKNRLR